MHVRKNANKELLNILTNYLEKHPEIRFSQAIENLNIVKTNDEYWVNEFYVESDVLLERVKGKL